MDISDIGAQLKQARLDKKLKIKKAATELCVKQEYLEAIEAGDVQALSQQIYLVGYIKNYAKWLGLDVEKVVSEAKERLGQSHANHDILNQAASITFSDEYTFRPTAWILFVSVILLIGIYSTWKYYTEKNIDVSQDMPVSVNPGVPPTSAVDTSSAFSASSTIFFQAKENKNFKGYIETKNNIIVLLSRANSMLELTYENGFVEKINLQPGETHFVSENERVYITTDQPEMVEVFREGQESTFLGTVQDFALKQ